MRKPSRIDWQIIAATIVAILSLFTVVGVIIVVTNLENIRISYNKIDSVICPAESVTISDITITDMDTNHVESNNLDIYPNSNFFNKYSTGDSIIAKGDLYSKTIGGETYYILVDAALYSN